MPFLDSSDGEWYWKQVISICDQAHKCDIDARVFAINGMLHADSQLVLDILAILDKAYVKVTSSNNVLNLGLVAKVDEEVRTANKNPPDQW
ncbi:hypothetical protein MMC17_008918 [Xylographa soralifera]|nr:hypothetical protein [Xylographa soralifera]